MRAPPPVRVVVPPRGAWRASCCAAWGLATGAFTAWALERLDLPSAGPAAVGAAAAAAVLAWRLVPTDAGLLVWDGSCWSFSGEPGLLRVMMDLDRWLLLRFEAEAGRIAWLGVGAGSAGAAWHGLRAAVYSPGSNAETA